MLLKTYHWYKEYSKSGDSEVVDKGSAVVGKGSEVVDKGSAVEDGGSVVEDNCHKFSGKLHTIDEESEGDEVADTLGYIIVDNPSVVADNAVIEENYISAVDNLSVVADNGSVDEEGNLSEEDNLSVVADNGSVDEEGNLSVVEEDDLSVVAGNGSVVKEENLTVVGQDNLSVVVDNGSVVADNGSVVADNGSVVADKGSADKGYSWRWRWGEENHGWRLNSHWKLSKCKYNDMHAVTGTAIRRDGTKQTFDIDIKNVGKLKVFVSTIKARQLVDWGHAK